MASVSYTVDLITQAQNPICWVASCAMVKGWGIQTSVGVGDFTGFDPSTASIANPDGSWSGTPNLVSSWGFNMQSVASLSQSGSMQASDLLQALTQLGPAVLIHSCNGFPYGSQWPPLTSGAHAVVLTSVDATNNVLTFNNPWGDLNQSAGIDPILLIMNNDAAAHGVATLGFWPHPANPTPTSQTT